MRFFFVDFRFTCIKSSMQVKTISYKDAKPIIQFLKTINCSYIVIQLNNFTLIFKKKKKRHPKNHGNQFCLVVFTHSGLGLLSSTFCLFEDETDHVWRRHAGDVKQWDWVGSMVACLILRCVISSYFKGVWSQWWVCPIKKNKIKEKSFRLIFKLD